MSAVVLVVTLRPSPNDRDEVVRVLEETVARVHAEDHGCELYSLHSDGDDFVLIEKWTDQAALDAHGISEATRAMGQGLKDKLREPVVIIRLKPIPLGDPRLGQI